MTKQLRFISLVPVLILAACQTRQPAPTEPPREVSLAADRSAVDHLRKEIPAETRTQNDQTALVLDTINKDGTFEEDPSKARERFGRIMREKRAASDKYFREKREAFTKEQKTKRDAFLTELREERSSYMAKKTSSADRRDFQTTQEKARQSYFGDESDRRKAFESSLTEERRKYEDSVREATNKFNDAIRDYSTEYRERKKSKTAAPTTKAREATVSSPATSDKDRALLEEFKQIPKGPAVPLAPTGPKGH